MYHVPKDWIGRKPDWNYSYSMAIGDACKVTIKKRATYTNVNPDIPYKKRHTMWVGGTAYNYGIGEANYPVPAIQTAVQFHPHSVSVATLDPVMRCYVIRGEYPPI